MAIQAAAAQALAAVRRARTFFAASPETVRAEPTLQQAADTTVSAGQRTGELSGVLISRHNSFVGQQALHLFNDAARQVDNYGNRPWRASLQPEATIARKSPPQCCKPIDHSQCTV